MIFINNKQQIKQYNSSVTVSLEFESLESFLQDAENRVIFTIGQGNAHAIKDSSDFVKTLIESAIVNWALGDYSDSGSMLIDDSGMAVVKSESKVPASDKKILNFKRSCLEKGWKAFEKAIELMESIYSDWPIWYLSAERTEYLSSYLNFSSSLERYSRVKVTPQLFQLLRPEIRRVEEDAIQQVLGNSVHTALHSRMLNHTLTTDDVELLKRITKVVAPLCVAYTIPYLSVQIGPEGVYQVSQMALSSGSDNVEQRLTAGDRPLQGAMARLISQGESELESLRIWMNDNKALFPGYVETMIAPMSQINDDPNSGIYFM